jgi:DNA repair protein RecN (Recombination protein N)
MLTELRITNFALIDRLTLELSSGFQVLTGETGAGKSILVDAIAILIGGRATADHIRSEAEESILEATFSLPHSHPVLDELCDQGLQAAGETDVIVRRILSRTGRHRIYINGSAIPLHTLQRLAGTLVDIHGQHDQQSLLSPKMQLEALDAFGDLTELRGRVATLYESWRVRQAEAEAAEQDARHAHAEEDLIRFQYDEIAGADLKMGEDEALVNERQRLAHAQRLAAVGQEAYEALYGADQSVLSGLARVAEGVTTLAGIDETQAEWRTLCDGAMVQLRELAHHLKEYHEQLDESPDRLEQVEARLDRLQRLKKKYGTTIEGLLNKAQALEQQLDVLSHSDARSAELHDLAARDARQLTELGEQLAIARRRAAGQMEIQIKKELQALRMEGTRVQIDVTTNRDGHIGVSGGDRVEFLLSTNPGEPVMPLAKVASGGELSRLMLAIKTVMAERDTVPVLIFDEIDTGIGGAVAAVMGRRLRGLSAYHQVLCITHLPQIASHATSHYRVEKAVEKKRTTARVMALDGSSRREEIARMIGGLSITKAVRDTAAQMIGEADRSPT